MALSHRRLTGERALFGGHDLTITDTIFAEGESPLKHGHDLTLDHVSFQWKYPLWYSRRVAATACTLLETARSGIWYAEDVAFTDSLIEAPKTFRRSRGVRLTRTDLPNAQETLWHCADVDLTDVSARGDYFGIDCTGVTATGLKLSGNYAFDGSTGVTVTDSVLLSKDAFWNCRDVTIRNSTIIGEYLGWNSTNVTFENCVIESLQGLCYIDGLVMKECRLLNTTLAFEYSTVDADIIGDIDSIINPRSGVVRCASVGEVTLDPERIDPTHVRIIAEPESRKDRT